MKISCQKRQYHKQKRIYDIFNCFQSRYLLIFAPQKVHHDFTSDSVFTFDRAQVQVLDTSAMVFARGAPKFYFLEHGSAIQRQKIIHFDRHGCITGVGLRNMVEQIQTWFGPFKIGLESDQANSGILQKVVFSLPGVGTFRADFEWIHF